MAVGILSPVATAQSFAGQRSLGTPAGIDGGVVEIIIRLRDPESYASTGDQADSVAGRVAALGSEAVYARTMRDGAIVYSLPTPVERTSARSLVNQIRRWPDVLYAEMVATEPARGAGSQGAATTDAPVAELIVKFKDPDLQAAANRGDPLTNGQVRRLSTVAGIELRHVRAIAGAAYVVALPDAVSSTEAGRLCGRLMEDPAIEYADPAIQMSPQLVPNDPFYPGQWHYFETTASVNAEPAWDITTGSSNVVVAVVDTGVLFAHPDLTGRLLAGYDFISESWRANDGHGIDADATDPGDWVSAGYCGSGKPARVSTWHGTHVAGTIGATSNNALGVAGLNWVSPLLPVRVLGKCGGSDPDIINGIWWAAGYSWAGVPANPFPARVINLSLGGPSASCPASYQDAINAALAVGAVVVVAAGNDEINVAGWAPANCNGVVVVHATNRYGGYAPYSNYGALVDISAPGGDTSHPYPGPFGTLPYDGVLSLIDTGLTSHVSYDYFWSQGTSQAAPHVSGVASLMLSRNPNLTPSQVEAIIEDTAWPFPIGTGADCDYFNCGAGIVDAAAAVAAVPTPTPTPRPTPTKTPTPTPSKTPTPTPTKTPTPTPTRTPTPTPSKTPTPTPTRTPTPAAPTPTGAGTRDDWDGDRRADRAHFSGSTGNWAWLGSSNGEGSLAAFGAGLQPVPGDYDGDGSTDAAVYDPATGDWQFSSSTAVPPIDGFGGPGFRAVPGDWDGDGTTDPAVYQVATGNWLYRGSTSGPGQIDGFGGGTVTPVPGDWDGDGKFDPAYFANGQWSYRGSTEGDVEFTFGGGAGGRFVPVPADYDGDGRMDAALYQKKKGKWRLRPSSLGGATEAFSGFGGAGFAAVLGDFDADGKVDPAIYRKSNGNWRYRSSGTGGFITLGVFGGPGLQAIVGLRP